MVGKARRTRLSQVLQPWAFPSIAACVGTGQAQVWAKPDSSQLQRHNFILPLKARGTEAHDVWEGDGGDRSWVIGFCSHWSKKDGRLVGGISGETLENYRTPPALT